MRPFTPMARPGEQLNDHRKPESEKWMTKEEVSALLWGATQVQNKQRFRAFDAFALMYLLGLRIGEVRLLRYEHLRARWIDKLGTPRAVDIPTLKKNPRPRGSLVPKPPPPLSWVPVLAHWSWVKSAFDPRERGGKAAASPWLFPSPTYPDKPITTRAIDDAWKRARVAAGLPDCYTPHAMRHSSAKALFAKHREISVVSRFLRHTTDRFGAGASATPTYIHMDVRDWEPMIKTKCMVLPTLKPVGPGARPHL